VYIPVRVAFGVQWEAPEKIDVTKTEIFTILVMTSQGSSIWYPFTKLENVRWHYKNHKF
jgi:hypothetical protein